MNTFFAASGVVVEKLSAQERGKVVGCAGCWHLD